MIIGGSRIAALLLAVGAECGQAQTVSIQSISDLALGQVTSASSGTTTFRIAASSGIASRVSGAGYRVGGGSDRALVTLACGDDSACADSDVVITVSSIGSSTGRLAQLSNFTITPATASIIDAPSGTGSLSFTIGPIGVNGTKSFYVGADLAIGGDDTGGATGAALANFQLRAGFAPSGVSDSALGTASATVFRALSLSSTATLDFGTIIQPTTGTATVAIDAATGARTVTGGARGIGSGAHRSSFSISGEGGQRYSVLVPSEFTMVGPGDPIIVSLTSTASGSQLLSGALGTAGSDHFGVGGEFSLTNSTKAGNYTGDFQVVVQYE